MQNSILLQNISVEELEVLLSKKINEAFLKFKHELKTSNGEELMTRTQACEFLSINQSTLFHWEKRQKIKGLAIGGRRYYRKSDILSCLKPL